MYYLSFNESATLVELANYQYVEKPTVTRSVHRLEELQYVKHIISKDRREKRMQMTELGKKVYQDVCVTIDQFEEETLQGISERELLHTIHTMRVIGNNIAT